MKIPVYCIYQNTMHTPAGLGSIIAFARQWKQGALNSHYYFVPQFFSAFNEVKNAVRSHGPGMFLFSDYEWNCHYHLKMSEKIRKNYPQSVILHGGPSVPNDTAMAQQFMTTNPSIDILVQGEGEITFTELLEAFKSGLSMNEPQNLKGIDGIVYRNQEGEIQFTLPRERARDLTHFPSPYTDPLYQSLNSKNTIAGIVETNRGCPYGCTYCDWGTRQRVRQFSMERVALEVDWIGRNKIPVLWISDANFGMYPRDLEVAKMAAQVKEKYGFPQQLFVNYAKNATPRVAEIVSVLAKSGLSAEGIISIQTRDEKTLELIERKNIKNEKFDDLIEIFKKENLPIASDLMIGLPGSSLETLKKDFQYFFDRDIKLKIYHNQILPNAPMASAEQRAKYKIETDKKGFVVACHTFSREDMLKIEKYSEVLVATVMFGTLKYFLKYLQLEHHIQASEFLHRLTDKLYDEPTTPYPEMRSMINFFTLKFDQKAQHVEYNWRIFFASWDKFFAETLIFLENEFGLQKSEELLLVLRAQKQLLPLPWRKMPAQIPLKHDLPAYLKQYHDYVANGCQRPDNFKTLSQFPPGELIVSDPNGYCNLRFFTRFLYNIHIIKYELESNLNSEKTKAVFVNEEGGDFKFWWNKLSAYIKYYVFDYKKFSGVGGFKKFF